MSKTIVSTTKDIKKNSFIGLGSRVNNNIIIEENCIVGSGSVVVDNIKKNQKIAGIPAKKIWKKKLLFLRLQEVIWQY